MTIPIEDFFEDIIGKAQRGLGISDRQLAADSGVSEEVIRSLKDGVPHDDSIRAVAKPLGLDAEALVVSAKKAWRPEPVDLPGLAVFNTPHGDMLVNAFLLWDPVAKNALAFDTGTDVSDLVGTLHEHDLTLDAILITHTHADHVKELATLTGQTGHPPVYVHGLEPLPGAETFAEGREWHFGKLHVAALQTSGHSVGGTTYVVSGLGRPVAVVGDAMFAGSMGGGMVSFTEALKNNREKIMTLSDDTILCPGHGPLTTVGEEKAHNPFFPEFR